MDGSDLFTRLVAERCAEIATEDRGDTLIRLSDIRQVPVPSVPISVLPSEIRIRIHLDSLSLIRLTKTYPHSSVRLDPDPHEMSADPKHCL
jgi:hypothetical protein